PDTRAALQRRLPQADLRDCTNLIRLIRMVKSEEELQRLTRAAQVNENAAMETLGMARPGVRTPELVATFRSLAAREGADFDHFAFSPRGWGIAMELDYTLQAGDVLYVDFGCIYEHYFSDSGTTLALDGASPEFDGKHAAVSAAIEAGLEALRPVAKASDVRAAMWRAMEERGITNSDPHGHSLGLEVREYPILVPNNGLRIRDGCVDVSSDLPLEAGMVLNLECAVLQPGEGSVHMERSFVVTTSGCRPLVPQERSQPVRPEPV
ncbi:MAG: M24 family metallopeptidase, partial [Vicinamibacteraceae bacterium]